MQLRSANCIWFTVLRFFARVAIKPDFIVFALCMLSSAAVCVACKKCKKKMETGKNNKTRQIKNFSHYVKINNFLFLLPHGPTREIVVLSAQPEAIASKFCLKYGSRSPSPALFQHACACACVTAKRHMTNGALLRIAASATVMPVKVHLTNSLVSGSL